MLAKNLTGTRNCSITWVFSDSHMQKSLQNSFNKQEAWDHVEMTMHSPVHSFPNSSSHPNRLPLMTALLLVVVLALAYVPLATSEGREAQVWFEDDRHELLDLDDDSHSDTMKISYDVDTSIVDGTHVNVKLYVKNGEGTLIDDPVNEHFVEPDTIEYWDHEWSAEEADEYTFELKLFHNDAFVESRSYSVELNARQRQGTVHPIVINNYDEQHGNLYFDGEKHDTYLFAEGRNELGEFTLAAGEHSVAVDLTNEAETGQEFTLEDGDSITIELTPTKEAHTGYARVFVQNDHDGQMGDLYFDGEKDSRHEITHGENNLGEYELATGDHEVYLELDNDADDLKEFTIEAGKTIDITLQPFKEDPHGLLKVFVDNGYDGQWSDLYINHDLIDEYEVASGEQLLDTLRLTPGEYEVHLELANKAYDGKEVVIVDAETTEVVLVPVIHDDTINIEGSIRAIGETVGLNDPHFFAHVRNEGVEGVAIKVYGEARGSLREGSTNADGYLHFLDLDPGRYEWEAKLQEELLEEGAFQVFGDLDKAARGDIYGHGEGEERQWDLFKVVAYNSEGHGVEGAKVRVWKGEDHEVARGATGREGVFMKEDLPQGWYSYKVEWPREQGEPILLSASQVYSYGPGEPEPARLYEPWLTPLEGELSDDYSFSVFYQDPQDRAPAWVKVYLDGSRYTHMAANGDDWANGVEFTVTIPGKEIGVGDHDHLFKAYVGDELLVTEKADCPFIDEDAKPYIEIKHPVNGALLKDLTEVVYFTEARTQAPYDIRLAYCPAKATDGGRQAGGDIPSCAPRDGGRQSPIDPWHTLHESVQEDSGVVTYTYSWDTTELRPATYLLRATIMDEVESMGEHIIKLIKASDEPEEKTLDVAVAVDPIVRTVKAGQEAVFTVTITNTGELDDTYLLTHDVFELNSLVEGWEVTWSKNQLAVVSGSYEQVLLTVSVPLEASAGDVIVLTVSAISIEDTSVKATGVASVIVASDQSGGGVLPALSGPMALVALSTGVVVASFRRRVSK